MPNLTITVKGNWAYLKGVRLHRVLHETLSAVDPQAWRTAAVKRGDSDGRVVLYDGDKFPAGLVDRAVADLRELDYTVKVRRPKFHPTPTDDLTPDYMLVPVEGEMKPLWDHVVDAVRAMMENKTGVIKSPTSSGKTSMMGCAALKFYCEHSYKSIIIVPKRGLLVKTVRELRQYYADLPVTVGQIGDGVKQPGDITVVTAQSCLGYWQRSKRHPKTKKIEIIKPDPVVRKVIDEADVLFTDECLPGDHMVETTEGPVRIDNPALKSKYVYGRDELTGRLTPCKVLRWLPRGKKQTYEVRLQSGEVIEPTHRTPLLTPRGWVMLCDLRVGDLVMRAGVVADGGLNTTAEVESEDMYSGINAKGHSTTLSNVWTGSPWTPLSVRAAVDKDYGCLDVLEPYTPVGNIGSGIRTAKNTVIEDRRRDACPKTFWGWCTGHYWGTRRSVTHMIDQLVRGWHSRTAGLSDNMLIGNLRNSQVWACECGPHVTKVMEHGLESVRQNVCLSWLPYTMLFGGEGIKELIKNGWSELHRRGAVGGIWMTGRWGRVGLCFTPNLIPEKKLISSRSGWWDWVTQTHLLQNQSRNTGSSDLKLETQQSSSMITPILHQGACQWTTSFSRVSEIRLGREVETFDIEVEKTHSFVSRGVLVHNCHHTGAESWYNIALTCKAKRRYGLSGTPISGRDLMDVRLTAAFGELIHEVPDDVLLEKGLVTKAKIVTVCHENASEPLLPDVLHDNGKPKNHTKYKQWKSPPVYADAYQAAIVMSLRHNKAVTRSVEWMVDQGRQTLVVTRRKLHFEILQKMMEERGLAVSAAWGDHDTPERDIAVNAFASRATNVLLATTIFDEGESVNAIEAIVLAEGVKVSINSVQRVGRGRRKERGGVDDLWVVDFASLAHDTLLEHAIARARAWEREGYDCRVLEEWPDMDDEGDFSDLFPFTTWNDYTNLFGDAV